MSDPTRAARRTVLAAGASVLAGGALAACGGADETKPSSEGGSAPTAQNSVSASSSAPASDAKALIKASEVPVGGGTVLKDQKLVVTQPTAGSFRCFTAVCTHQGCLVNKVEAGTIDCPCHGSKFKDTDGAVAKGPATKPLEEKKITVSPAGEISLA
ncbi:MULTISPECIES: Rieske (2Fe-2S) protein [unclassified Streptomyces]|uniref:Rieske (2Fe-2S) protein n=1 Tax=unclassified Streptomyces TaxID=2593676 RepID=UPI002030AD15|nr:MULTISPECIES: Rieske (2Fe-2S) protein [unclassified Streptomyces]MCM1966817.1 Rieske (2Fe-2S) protein [Streptomyces sp. G1]MCX5128757.1 Rieske (2Fe-2S) protein [Streptomyces sp. NBC_00347]MCX5299294.1 Rieske (2Fe-2S) protein [Streptomyces sp. NBC_00193]